MSPFSLHVQVGELREQLVASVELGQTHFQKNNDLRIRIQHMKSIVVKRIIGQWLHATASSFFGAWVQAVHVSRERPNEDMDALVMEALRGRSVKGGDAIVTPRHSLLSYSPVCEQNSRYSPVYERSNHYVSSTSPILSMLPAMDDVAAHTLTHTHTHTAPLYRYPSPQECNREPPPAWYVSLSLSLSLSLAFSLSFSFSFSLVLSRFVFRSLSLPVSLSQCLSFSLSFSFPLSVSLSERLSLTLTLLSFFLSLCLILSLSRSFSRSFTHPLSPSRPSRSLSLPL